MTESDSYGLAIITDEEAKSKPAPPSAEVLVSLTRIDTSLALQFTQKSGPKVVDDDKGGNQYIRIDEEVDIAFRLDQSEFAWYFDMTHTGITLKVVPGVDVYKGNYRRRPHAGEKPTELVVNCTPRPNPDPHNPDVENHPFNIWVKLPQPSGTRDLAVCIDPDIKNPPPPPQ